MGEKAAGLGELQLSSGTGKGALALASHSLPVSVCPGSNDPALWAGWDSLLGRVPHVRGTHCHPGLPLPLKERGGGSRRLPLTHLLVPLLEILALLQQEGDSSSVSCGCT